MLGLGLNINKNRFVGGGIAPEIQYFVRPAGTTYGDGSGTSYANAWSGFSSINWSLLENQTLNICGTHYERLVVGQNNVTLVGNNINESGIIDGQSLRQCLNITSYNNITVNGLTCNNGLNDCVINANTTGNVYNYCIFDTSTNQTAQHEGIICSVTYNNCTFRNGVDDGVSLHDANTTVILNNCHFENNDMGLQSISNGVSILNNCTFLNNISLDVRNDDTSILTATNCVFRKNVQANSSGLTYIKNSRFLSGITSVSVTGNLLIEDSAFTGTSTLTYARPDITKVRITRCYFEVNSSDKITRVSNGNLDLSYSTFKFLGNFGGIVHGGTSTAKVNNCNFISTTNVGTAVASLGKIDLTNCIFQGLNRVVNTLSVSAIVNLNFSNTYLNTTIHVGSGTFTNTNNITTNPLFTNIATNDYRLQVGSGAIGTGLTLTNAVGIETADWNSSIPSVTTKNQGASWNRGAYVN